MTRNEAQTRKDIIDKRLLLACWNVNNPTQVTKELDIFDAFEKFDRIPYEIDLSDELRKILQDDADRAMA